MIEPLKMSLGLLSPFWLAQVPVNEAINTPERVAFAFSGPQFFAALVSGIVLAFAFQILLTNLSVALGISVLGRSGGSDDDSSSSGSLGGTIKKISFAVGLWTLITVSIALFIACLLAVKLTLAPNPVIGAITGVVIWGAYFTLLVWAGSSTVGSLVGSVVNTATSGFQAIVGTATAAIGAKAVNDQVVSTAEAAAAAVRREFGSGLDPVSLRDTLEDYIETLRPPELDMNRVRGEFEKLVNDPELKALAGGGSTVDLIDRLRSVDRNTFVNLISNRTDLSKRDANRLVDQLDSVWHQVVSQFQPRRDATTELVEYLKSVQPNTLDSDEVRRRLDELSEQVRRQGELVQQTQATGLSALQSGMQGSKEPSLVDRAMQFGLSTIMGTVMGRTDLSDLDVEKILGQLQGLTDKTVDQTQRIAGSVADKTPFNTIKADAENYLRNSYAWHFNRASLETEFRDVIYDPEADPNAVLRQLEQIDRATFVEALNQRGDLSEPRITEIADQLETIRMAVLSQVRQAATHEEAAGLRGRVENYLRSTNKAELSPESIERDFSQLLNDPEAGYDALKTRLSHFDRATLVALLANRQDMTPEEADRVVGQLEMTRDRVLHSAQDLQFKAQARAAQVRSQVESYLRNTGKSELNPEAIERELKLLLNDPQAGSVALRERLKQFDRNTIVALLSQRQDMTAAEADRVVGKVESVRDSILTAPQTAVDTVKTQYDQTTTAIEDYLRRTNLRELDPDGIKRDLQLLSQDPKSGASALRERLAQMDRQTLVKLLSQRQDLSEEQVNQAIDQIQTAIRSVVRAPRRFAARTQAQVQDFQSTLEDYLRNTHKAELNPEGIKRDLQLMLTDPRASFGNLGNRLGSVDRATIVALLSQRQDMTEEEANRVVDQVLSVREQVAMQVQKIQDRIQGVIDSILARIRDYLNSLNRDELNYDGIRRDVRTLFNDPKAGFDALRDRLSSFDRNTVVALLSSRDDISEAEANRIVDQVESARMNVLQRAERIQAEAQRRVEEVKYQAQKQVRETRKAAESAAWWLFATALVSGILSAVAGAIAVSNT